MLPLSRGVTFEDLCDGVASMLHINREDSKLTIWYIFSFQCHPHLMIYQQVLVEYNNGINAIFNMLGYQYEFIGAELYVGVESIKSYRDVFPIRYISTKDRVHRLVIHIAGTFMIHMPLILVIILKMQLIPQSTLVVLTIMQHIPMLQLRTNMFLIGQ